MKLVSGLDRIILGEEFRILRTSSSDTGSKNDKVLLLLLCLVAETGINDCSATLIFIILSLKKCPKVLAKSVGLI